MVHNQGLPPGLPTSPLLAFPLTPASTSATDAISNPNLRDCEPQSGQAICFPAGVLGAPQVVSHTHHTTPFAFQSLFLPSKQPRPKPLRALFS